MFKKFLNVSVLRVKGTVGVVGGGELFRNWGAFA